MSVNHVELYYVTCDWWPRIRSSGRTAWRVRRKPAISSPPVRELEVVGSD